MKLIIDIDEQHFELLQMAVMNGMGDNAQKIIAQGIPLEQIRDEIEGYKSTIDNAISEDELKIEGMKEAYNDCLDIIDRYMKGDKA